MLWLPAALAADLPTGAWMDPAETLPIVGAQELACTPGDTLLLIRTGEAVVAWDVARRAEAWRRVGAAAGIAVAPDGSRVAVIWDDRVELVDAAGTTRWSLPVAEPGAAGFSPDGAELALSLEEEGVRVVAADDGRTLAAYPLEYGADIAAITAGGWVWASNALTHARIRRADGEIRLFDSGFADHFALGADGRTVWIGEAVDPPERWDVETLVELPRARYTDLVYHLDVAADGTRLLLDHALYDVASGASFRLEPSSFHAETCFRAGALGAWVVADAGVETWWFASPEELAPIGPPVRRAEPLHDAYGQLLGPVAWLDDDTLVVGQDDGRVRTVTLDGTSRIVGGAACGDDDFDCVPVAVSARRGRWTAIRGDGRRVGVGGPRLRARDATPFRAFAVGKGWVWCELYGACRGKGRVPPGLVPQIAAARASWQPPVRPDGAEAWIGIVEIVGVSADGRAFAVSARKLLTPGEGDAPDALVDDRQLHVYRDGALLWSTPVGTADHVAFSPDGRRVAIGDYAVRLFDLASGREIRQVFAATDFASGPLAFSPDSTTVVFVQTWDDADHLYRVAVPP